MNRFEYASPATLKEALALLGPNWNAAAVLAGGTDLLALMKSYVYSPARLVNIKGIKELGGITKTAGGVRIGATVTLQELIDSPIIRAEFPSLVQAAREVHSMQIRNMGTVGGDVCQRPRCWYFRNGFGLLALDRSGGGSLVEKGRNEFHAIFSNGPAKFVSASSFGPPLAALGAKIKLVSATASREVDAAQFFVSPKSELDREVDLMPDEILTEIVIPSKGLKNATYSVIQKQALDWPLASASVALQMKGATVVSASIVLGAVAPVPWAAKSAAAMLAGKTITESVAEEAGKAAVQGARPLSENGYKIRLAQTAVKRALLLAATGKA